MTYLVGLSFQRLRRSAHLYLSTVVFAFALLLAPLASPVRFQTSPAVAPLADALVVKRTFVRVAKGSTVKLMVAAVPMLRLPTLQVALEADIVQVPRVDRRRVTRTSFQASIGRSSGPGFSNVKLNLTLSASAGPWLRTMAVPEKAPRLTRKLTEEGGCVP
jgi:hypothetical protein